MERFLAHAGLAFQSALAQNLLASKGLILGILLLGLFFLVLHFGLSGDTTYRLRLARPAEFKVYREL